MQTELLLIVVAKALVELAGLFLLGRGLLYILAGRKRADNIFYQLFCIVTKPVLRAARFVTPRIVMDNHMPMVAFVLMLWIWLAIVFWVLPEMCDSGHVDCTSLLQRKHAD